jgi:outer membrane immunogenic protein
MVMKTILLGALAVSVAVTAVSQIAFAADKASHKRAPVFTKAPPPAPPPSWAGFYIGVDAGGVWGREDIVHSPVFAVPGSAFQIDSNAVTIASSPSFRPSSFTGGGHAGYNYQSGPTVLGVEADFSYLGLRSSTSGVFPFPSTLPGGPLGPPTLTFTSSTSVQNDWLFTFRPRLGMASQNFLLYATGGLAVTNEQVSQTTGVLNSASFVSTISTTRAGWVAGFGGEYMISPSWSLRAEYLHLDFGTATGAGVENLPAGVGGNATCVPSTVVVVGPTALQGCSISAHLTADLVRVGISHKLDWAPAAVVTKY